MSNAQSTGLRDLIFSHAQRIPNHESVLSLSREPLTYIQLSVMLDDVARTLRAAGIMRTDCVAVVLPNGPEMATAFLSIAACATCAPLNPAYRREDFQFYLSDLEAKAVVVPADCDSPARKVATELGLLVIELLTEKELPAGSFSFQSTATNSKFETSVEGIDWGQDDDVALVLHTSGTTSRPKQVPLSHRNLRASANNISQTLDLSPDDRSLNVMPLFHIHGLVGSLLSSLHSGGSVVCTAGFSADSFGELIHEFRPTWYSAVPTIHQSVIALTNENPTVAGNGCLRLIRSSSSALPPTVMAGLEEAFGVPVVESYGMTEAAHQMASNPLPPAARKPGSVGVPGGPEMAIMDDDGNLLDANLQGEIVIRGPNVTAGYANNPQANDDSFTNGWFRTGDLGRTDPDGYFFITGRKKEMINRGGENISPREIDETLLEHPAVRQAVAFAVPHPTLGEDVNAAVVLHTNATVSDNDLRRFAFERLAPFKVPSRIITMTSIPKGATGKLKRIGLHLELKEQLAIDYVEPSTDLERMVVDAISDVLRTDRVGVKDNFFALGGDSLKAVRVLASLSAQLHVGLPAVTLFLNPTARELSLEITSLMADHTGMMEELLAEIEGMSDEEARKHLE